MTRSPRAVQHPSPLWRVLHSDRGDGPVASAMLAGMVLTLIFGAVQTGLGFHARHVAESGAQVGYEQARAHDGSAGDGEAATREYFTDVGAPDSFSSAQVSASRSGDTARVEVTAEIPQIVPVIPLPEIQVHASGPVERVSQP